MDYLIYIKLPPYLRQWYQHEMDQVPPYHVPKNSTEFSCIKFHLRKPRADDDIMPKDDSYTSFRIPNYREFDIRTYNFLSKEGRQSLEALIHEKFCYKLFQDLLWLITFNRAMNTKSLKAQKQNNVLAWMKKNGITNDETNYHSVLKNFDRMREKFLKHVDYS